MLDDRKSDVIYSVIPVRGVVYPNQVVKIVISKRSSSIDLIEHLLHLGRDSDTEDLDVLQVQEGSDSAGAGAGAGSAAGLALPKRPPGKPKDGRSDAARALAEPSARARRGA